MSYVVARLLRNEYIYIFIFIIFFSSHIGIVYTHTPYSLFFCAVLKIMLKNFAITVHIKSPHYNIYPPPDSQVGGKKELLFISEFISNRTVSKESNKFIIKALPEHHITYLHFY